MITSELCIQNFKNEYRFRLKEETSNLYELAMKQLLSYCEKPFNKITAGDIRSWMLYLETIGGYKPRTVKCKLAGLKLFYKYCTEEELMERNPAESIPFPEIEDRLPYYLEQEHLEKLRRLVEGRLQERAIIELLFATGIRISELAAMKKEDIVWSERIIHIPEGKRKKGRIVCFSRMCGEHLKAYLEEREDNLPYVFLNKTKKGPLNIRTTNLDFENYARQLGFHLTPHTLRHTFAAHLARKGMQLQGIQLLLGHNGPHQTKLYARLYNHARKQMYDELM